MSKVTFILIGVTYCIVAIITIVLVLHFLNRKENKKYQEEINNLEREKNLIISGSILSELNKVSTLLTNSRLEDVYTSWQNRFNKIKDEDIPKITDTILEIEDDYSEKRYKDVTEKIAKCELDIYYIKTKANYLLEEIRGITQSEEKNRDTITKLKTEYREVLNKYNNSKEEFGEIQSSLNLQFENVEKLFSAFEVSMENKQYEDVSKIVKAAADSIGNLSLIIDEAPSIVLLSNKIIPEKMTDIASITDKMTKEGYNLDYLNIDYNIKESNKKIQDVLARLKVLNIEDSSLILKTMTDYFDNIYNEFDKEKVAKKIFEDYSRTILVKATKLESVNNNLYKKLDDIKFSYDLDDEDLKVIGVVKTDLKQIKKDYEIIINSYRSKKFAYTRLGKEMELLNNRLTITSENLEHALKNLGSLKEDEQRARDQLTEIKDILNNSKNIINSYKLPIIPKRYYIELSEANDALKEMVKELETTPISIKILNTRVDTARDLILKVYNTSKEIVKTAKMAEMSIVYGNRYRPVSKSLELGLAKAENEFNKGDYKTSLENAITSINLVEPGIYKRLMETYK